jgi:GNAT superfamily N-acetyltransferase
MVVRLAASKDTEQILTMNVSAQGDEPRRRLVEKAIEHGECVAAEENGVLIGYGVMNHDFFARGFVSMIYVQESHRRKRVGSRLFDQFEGRCRTNRIFTSTNLSNVSMQAFLVSRGYVLSGVVHHLDEGDPEMFYSKRLR